MSLSLPKNQRGIGLIEVIFALGVAIVVVTAMISLAIFTLRATTENGLLVKGTRLSNQQMERVRVYRDGYGSTWTDLRALLVVCTDSSFCYIDSSFLLQSGTITADGITTYFYVREVTGKPGVLDIITVSTWAIGGKSKYAHNYSRLSNWQN